jgi:hypothetical protein
VFGVSSDEYLNYPIIGRMENAVGDVVASMIEKFSVFVR